MDQTRSRTNEKRSCARNLDRKGQILVQAVALKMGGELVVLQDFDAPCGGPAEHELDLMILSVWRQKRDRTSMPGTGHPTGGRIAVEVEKFSHTPSVVFAPFPVAAT